eukprot:TRINITY_DN12122_c0_g1_i1.p1 TRINITY_DN12122_c0_g1~~TRINITY_DN12122_c0_g1_i1.p1  ORF type:complete len:420 (-),score=132.52 TRINITY_DN12122_c0_g1_i1:92-1249(-)
MSENEEGNKLSLIRVKRKIGDLPPDSLLVNIPTKKPSILQSFQSLSTAEPHVESNPPTISNDIENNNNNNNDSNKRHRLYRLVDTITPDLLHVFNPDQLKHKIDSLKQESETGESPSESHAQSQSQTQPPTQPHRILKAHRYKQVKIDVPELKTKLNEHSSTFEILDVIKFETPERKLPSVKRTGSHAPPPTPIPSSSELTEEVLNSFYPMVKEYLKTRDPTLPQTITPATQPISNTANNLGSIDQDGDYVIDFYYQDTQTSPKSVSGIPEVNIEPFDEDLGLEDEYVNESDEDSEKKDLWNDVDTDSENRGSDYPDEEDEEINDNEKAWGYENSNSEESDEYDNNWRRNRDEDSESYDLDDYEDDDARRFENKSMMPYDPEFDD